MAVNDNGVEYATSTENRCDGRLIMGDYRGDVGHRCDLVPHIPEVMHEAVLAACKPVGHLRWKDD